MNERLALITGATSGIGKSTCELFAQKGINLIISGRNQQELQRLQENLSRQVNVQIIQADLLHKKERQRLIDILHTQVPDLIINNAGFGLYGDALTYSTDDQTDILEVNGRAVVELTLEAARSLISANKKGVILNVSSVSAYQIIPTMAMYAASKSFVSQFSQAFDFEVKKHGVRILTICPGVVATEFQSRAGGECDDQQLGILTSSFVAEQIWKQIEQLKPVLIIDWKYRLLTYFSFFLPKSWVAKFIEREINKRTTPRPLIKLKHES